MEDNIKRILSTRPVDENYIQIAAAKNIAVDVLSFIETFPVKNDIVQQSIDAYAMQASTVIFTSMNAVEAVGEQLNGKLPLWNIFCMGNTTRLLVEKYFGKQTIVATASDASGLAGEVIAWKEDKQSNEPVIFFCGDQRRDELPEKLAEGHIAMKEIVTYQTMETSFKVDKSYDGVLFFSPSAVHSFFANNAADERTIFFAIGNTTANTIMNYCNNKIITGTTPAKNELLLQAVDFLSGNTNTMSFS